MKKYNRIFTVVLDSAGIGNAHDAAAFGDEGANTLGTLHEKLGLDLPNLFSLGLDELITKNVNDNKKGVIAALNEKSPGKDSVMGHWEMMGCIAKHPFLNFCDNGFPQELISEFEARTGRKVLANKEANGMKIIEEFGKEQYKSGSWIVYTSVDSTFQIASNEDIISLDELYSACKIARELCNENPAWGVSRVIARPWVYDNIEEGTFHRTGNRHDYAMAPTSRLVLEDFQVAGVKTIGVGKIYDLVAGVGIDKAITTKSNMEGCDVTIDLMKGDDFTKGFCFVNLVEFDSVFGHPRDPEGYKQALNDFDEKLGLMIDALKEDDLLIITADHGTDPFFKGNDHCREQVPFVAYAKGIKPANLGEVLGFDCIGKTIAKNFDVTTEIAGEDLTAKLTND